MELVFLEYFFPRLIPHKVNIALSGRYYWKLLKALGQYGLRILKPQENLLPQLLVPGGEVAKHSVQEDSTGLW